VKRLIIAASLLALDAAPAGAASQPGRTIFQSRHLWATVDICNTPAHPRTIGVRGSMPGSGVAAERMYMRFRVQYRTPAGQWVYISSAADSGFLFVGAATYKARQAGRSFQIAASSGGGYVVRGVVDFQWRRRARVIRHARKATTAGHTSLAGSDPAGYSAAACSLP
jgi:hypothetical protein